MPTTVYSTPPCPWCHTAKQFPTQRVVSFTDIDVSRDQKAADEMVEKTGQMGVPVIDIDGMIIVGFDQAAILGALKQRGQSGKAR